MSHRQLDTQSGVQGRDLRCVSMYLVFNAMRLEEVAKCVSVIGEERSDAALRELQH